MPGSALRLSRFCSAAVLLVCLSLSLPCFAVRGMFQGRVIEGTQREAGKFIYIAAGAGHLRRVDVRHCHVSFAPSVPSKQRTQTALESLRDSAEVRVVADQLADGEWVAVEITIMRLPLVDQARLLT
jgi:hypothetical protein